MTVYGLHHRSGPTQHIRQSMCGLLWLSHMFGVHHRFTIIVRIEEIMGKPWNVRCQFFNAQQQWHVHTVFFELWDEEFDGGRHGRAETRIE